ncbi:hypothetical protein FA95DRAFT_1501923 [Auriscalpium vulgare]|uniref:Uncharacterized protein n=1 Tax=Auriscalpium vulgare TaxID=40419 RepID=A0ACB8RAX6_9AGAM|nr:hypothetical protein FA95DRAFT_1501923 [Auriscalpium vulgare]
MSFIGAGGAAGEDGEKTATIIPPRTPSPDKPLPIPPGFAFDRISVEEILDTSAPTPSILSKTGISKRNHALLEILSSERAYASDLALIRDIHIPLALGQQTPFPITPPQSSSSSGRTLSTASDSSSGSNLGPPMTRDDSRIIFSNIAKLALFSDTFTDKLEEALGSVLEGGHGDDHVGALFIDTAPEMEPLYKSYITHHPEAVDHLNKLPQTPALIAYLAHTRTLASSLTHAWDLPSLLIKPVQRLLKYSLLLNAVVEETPDKHPDKANLRRAKAMMEAVSHAVNEGQRRREIVKEVLAAGKPSEVLKKRGLNAPVVSLGRVKPRPVSEENAESEEVARMERQIREAEGFAKALAKESTVWGKSVQTLVEGLREWALGFGRVLGLSPEATSEAFDAFILVVDPSLMDLCGDLQALIRDQLLPQLSLLVNTATAPICLLDAMHMLEPHHYGLLHHNIAKGRPMAVVLEASRSYLALRAQLHEDLPRYIALLRRGITLCVQQLAKWQAQFYRDVRERWGELWDALRVEGEMNAGAEETARVWRQRWSEVEKDLLTLNILHPEKSVLKAKPAPPPPSPTAVRTLAVASLFGALEPPGAPAIYNISEPSALRSRGSGSAATSSRKNLARQTSDESLRSIRSAKSGKSSKSKEQPAPKTAQQQHPRRQSMPAPLHKASSQGRLLEAVASQDMIGEERGRTKAGLGFIESLKPSLTRRSSSRNSMSGKRPTPSPRSATFSGAEHYSAPPPPPSPQVRLTVSSKWHSAPPLYSCRVIHACDPPDGVSYYGLPFFPLYLGDVFEVLKEAGHPSRHPDLPLYVDDGDDCLLLARDAHRDLGWVLASFLYPVD